jgi:hypothetical protein
VKGGLGGRREAGGFRQDVKRKSSGKSANAEGTLRRQAMDERNPWPDTDLREVGDDFAAHLRNREVFNENPWNNDGLWASPEASSSGK